LNGKINYMEELNKKLDRLDKLIDNYSLLYSNSTNDVYNKSSKLIIEMLLNQKVKIKNFFNNKL